MYHTPFTWYEQESLGHNVHFEAFLPELCSFCFYFRLKVDHKDAVRRSCRPVRAVAKPLTQRFGFVLQQRMYT